MPLLRQLFINSPDHLLCSLFFMKNMGVCNLNAWRLSIWEFAKSQALNIPRPSKGCQMVPKGCQFTIPWGFIGTPWKVLVYLSFTFSKTQQQTQLQTWFWNMFGHLLPQTKHSNYLTAHLAKHLPIELRDKYPSPPRFIIKRLRTPSCSMPL